MGVNNRIFAKVPRFVAHLLAHKPYPQPLSLCAGRGEPAWWPDAALRRDEELPTVSARDGMGILRSDHLGRTMNSFQSPGEIRQNLLVREPQDVIAGRSEHIFPFGIAILLCLVNLAVNFHNQALLDTAEIRDEGTNRMLPEELHSFQSSSAQSFPEHLFGWRLSSP